MSPSKKQEMLDKEWEKYGSEENWLDVKRMQTLNMLSKRKTNTAITRANIFFSRCSKYSFGNLISEGSIS